MDSCEKSYRATVTRAPIGQALQCVSAAAVFNICRMAFLIGPLWLSVAVTAAARADTTVLVGTHGNADSTLTGGIRSFAVTNSGSTWTQSGFNSDGWLQTIDAGVNGLAQDIYGNVYAAVNTGTNATRGIRIYRQTGGASVGYVNSTWGSGNLTGNSPDGLAIGADGRLYATVPFGTGNNKLLSFNTTTLSGGQIQTGQGGSDTGLTGLSTPRGITVASDGNFYLANRGTQQILRWTGSGTTATVLATNNTGTAQYQTVSWDAGGNRLLTASGAMPGGAFALVGSLTLAGAGSDASIRTTDNADFSLGLAVVDGLVAFTQFTPGKVATATGDVNTQTDRVTGLSRPSGMLVLRDTRLWEGGVGSWATGANWRQGIGGTTGAATFTSGSGATSLPSVLTFTGTAGGTATNDVAGTVNVGGLNFAPGAGAYTLAGSSFTLAPNANIRNLSTNSQAISADIVLAGDQWVQADPGSSLSLSGGISGAAALRKLGSGTLTLSGNNSYSGTTTVSAGVLEIGSGGTTGSVAGNVSNNATVIFNRSNALTYAGTISGSGALTKLGSGILTLSGSNTYSGNTTVSAGVLAISNTTALPGWNVSGRLAVAGGAALAVGNSVNDAAVATLLSTGSNFQAGAAIGFDTIAGNRTYAEAIGNTAQGSLGLVKLGSGTLTLSGNNSYSGGTTISGGRLEIAPAGRLAASGPITINGLGAEFRYNAAAALAAPLTLTQGTISGTGTIGTAVVAGANAILAPGNSPGAQAYSSGLTWNPGGTYQWEINDAIGSAGTNWDVINVSGGALNLAGLSSENRFILDLTTLTGTASGQMLNYVDGQSYTFSLATYSSLELPTGFSGNDLTTLFTLSFTNWLNPDPSLANVSVVNDVGTSTINLVIVPEPSGLVLAGLGIAAAAVALRRRWAAAP